MTFIFNSHLAIKRGLLKLEKDKNAPLLLSTLGIIDTLT